MSLNATHWSKYIRNLAERLDMQGSTGGRVNVVVGDARALRDCADFLAAMGGITTSGGIRERTLEEKVDLLISKVAVLEVSAGAVSRGESC